MNVATGRRPKPGNEGSGEPRLSPLAWQQGDFRLEPTLDCGQVFHWRRLGAGWIGVIGSTPVYIEQSTQGLAVSQGAESAAAHYFGLDHPLADICASFPKDPAMQEAGRFCSGMRILRQPFWECLATFITSSMKQVPHIAQMSHAIRGRFGERVQWGDQTLYAYPSPAQLALATEEELRGCKLGFRAKNLLASARMIASGQIDLNQILLMDDDSARLELCKLPGVGLKVANCALLFGAERLAAFPIDVWIERILRVLYFARKRNVTAKRLQAFSADHFGPYGGYAQQYLFHHARKTWKDSGPGAGKPVGSRAANRVKRA